MAAGITLLKWTSLLASMLLVMPARSQSLNCADACTWDPAIPSAGTGTATSMTSYPGSLGIVWSTVDPPGYRSRLLNVVADRLYELSICPADGGSYSSPPRMSLLDPVSNTPLCHWDVPSSCGVPKMRFYAAAAGQVKLVVTDDACGDGLQSAHVRWINLSIGGYGCANATGGADPATPYTPSCTGHPEVSTASAASGESIALELLKIVAHCPARFLPCSPSAT